MKIFIHFQHLLLFLYLFNCEAKILPERTVTLSAEVKLYKKFPFGYNNISSRSRQEMKDKNWFYTGW